MRTVLLAGFGAFPNAPINPSRLVVEAFPERRLGPAVELRRLVLPVVWGAASAELEVSIRRWQPVAVLLVGLQARAERFRIERRAFNECAVDKPDAAGRPAAGARACDGPAAVDVAMPADAIQAGLNEAGIAFDFSDDPGRYLCNETLFRLGLSAGALGVRRWGFVHTPYTDAVSDVPAGCAVVPAARLEDVCALMLSRMVDEAEGVLPLASRSRSV